MTKCIPFSNLKYSEDLKKSNISDIAQKIKVFEEFTKAVDRMIAGEYIDTEFEGKKYQQMN